jgi:hypothetical protein
MRLPAVSLTPAVPLTPATLAEYAGPRQGPASDVTPSPLFGMLCQAAEDLTKQDQAEPMDVDGPEDLNPAPQQPDTATASLAERDRSAAAAPSPARCCWAIFMSFCPV